MLLTAWVKGSFTTYSREAEHGILGHAKYTDTAVTDEE